MPNLQPFTFDRIIRAVQRVRERLLKSTAALERANIPYAATGGNAVAYWVSKIDPAAVRNTPDVDLLVRRSDRERVRSALETAGFIHRDADGADLFLENPEDANRHATRLFFPARNSEPTIHSHFRTFRNRKRHPTSKFSRWKLWREWN